MITKVNQLNLKSWVNYTNPDEYNFDKKNLIFGENGRGKSSLAEGVYLEYVNKNDANSIRFFKREFVDTIVSLQESTKINGVRAIFGDSNIDKEIEIRKLIEEIIDINPIDEDIKQVDLRIRDILDTLHESKKGDISHFPTKQKKLSTSELLFSLESDLNKVLSIEESREKLKNLTGNTTEIEHQLEILKATEVLEIMNFRLDLLEPIQEMLNTSYDKSDIPSYSVVEWIRNGVDLHKSKNHCQFCTNSIDVEEIEKKLELYLKNKKQKDSAILNNFIIDLRNTVESSVRVFTRIDDYARLMRITEDMSALTEVIKEIESFIKNLEIKINDMSERINQNLDPLRDAMINIDYLNNILKESRENQIKSTESKLDRIRDLVRGSIAASFLDDSNVQDLLRVRNELAESLTTAKQKNIDTNESIEEIRKQISEYSDFMEFINKVLDSLEININLQLDTENDSHYVLVNSRTSENLSLDSISEGEKNLFALIFFYFELFNDENQENIKDEVKCVIIDDPVSSLDDTNRFYVLELVNQVFEIDDDVQIFVFTHSWDDFCSLAYGKNNYKMLEIYKDIIDDSSSKLRKSKSTASPYRKLFTEIFLLSNMNRSDEMDDCARYHSINSMRRIFEEFLKFKSSTNLLPQASNLENIVRIYNISAPAPMSKTWKNKLSSFLVYINVLSHTANRSEHPSKYAKILMKFIKDTDPLHFEAMQIDPSTLI